ncbi:DUF7344 domain-containing protein [Halobaculum marinum]|uniref:DUF7344 domain-containing protein n=1 Tax=Halobaculum marinum TaxID=3031996 RepID=A0ABD5WU39_9EURY|nr:hypothetical protein [Halobaculum sp. DT55]
MTGHDLTVDGLYEVLSDGTRRRLLWTMLDSGPPMRLRIPEDLPRDVADHRPRRIQLHHVHLPKLVDAGLVSWDDDRGEVTGGPTFDRAKPLLAVARDGERVTPLPGAV